MNTLTTVNVSGMSLPIMEVNGTRVLTTAQLAECYGTDTNTVKVNFNRNKDRYEEGKHFLCLKGTELQAFKNNVTDCNLVGNRASTLYLWTERGALLHAKSLGTNKAWEVYDILVDNYFTSAKIVTITPTDAARILAENNLNNRKINQANVRKYADDMLLGKFELNGDTIRFYADGTLADGQHRLMACVLSGVPFKTYVVKGLEKKVLPTIDCGKPRNMVETLNMIGCGVNKMIVPAMNLYFNNRASLTANQVQVLWDKYSDKLERLCTILKGSHHDHILSQKDVRAYFMHLLLAENWTEDDVQTFVNGLKTKPNCVTNFDYTCYNFRRWYDRRIHRKITDGKKCKNNPKSLMTIEGLCTVADSYIQDKQYNKFAGTKLTRANGVLERGQALAQIQFQLMESSNLTLTST